MRSLVIACLSATIWSTMIFSEAHAQQGTRVQHHGWIRKLETPGGTFPYSPDASAEQAGTSGLSPDETRSQHRSWIRKWETPDGTFSVPL